MTQKSIYEYITDNIADGLLPNGFSLGPFKKGDRALFADGAADGIAIYHTALPELPANLPARIARGIEQARVDDYEGANDTFVAMTDENPAIALIDEIQQFVLGHSEDLDAQALWAYATFLLFISDEVELVKVGLSLLEIFGEPEEQVKQVVRTLGLSDEFTIFAAWCMRSWTDGNEELFQLAMKTDGWGRIHAVEMLEPNTPEIRDWLLFEGVNNTVMPEYSALTCYVKAGVSELLAGEMDRREFAAATAIVHAALSDAPVAGFAALDDPEGELNRYIAQASRQALDTADRECLAAMAEYADAHGWSSISAHCRELLGS